MAPWCHSIGSHLQLCEMLRAFLDVHPSEANPDGPRGDNDYAVAIFAQFHSCVDDESQNWEQGLVGLLIDD